MNQHQKSIMKEDYFRTWSPNMAYILGFIVADGCIAMSDHSYRLIIVSKDKDVLEFIKSELEYKYDIAQQKDGIYRLSISRKNMVMDLMALGVLPRKSWNPILPDVPMEYLNAFTLGYLDGDGCIDERPHKDCPGGYQLRMRFTSYSKAFLQQLGNQLKDQTGYIPKIHSHVSKKAFEMTASTHEAILLYHYLYDSPPDFYLSRKKNRILNWLKRVNDINWGVSKCKLCGSSFVKTHDKSKRCWNCKKAGKHIKKSRYSPAAMVT